MDGERLTFTVKYRGEAHSVSVPAESVLQDVGEAIEQQLGLAFHTIKLLGVKGAPGGAIVPVKAPQSSAADAGLRSGLTLSVLGSKTADVKSVEQQEVQHQNLRLPSFEHEALVSAARRTYSRDVKPPAPGTPYTFGDYQVLHTPGLYPAPGEALKLLYRLAGDAGIMAIMEKHSFSVGLLAEMPPEGTLGVDPVCVLGYNTNKGQSIHLRLRTDDLKGFRKFELIRETLCHELTHNVWSEHDNNFKALCSQLNREVQEVHLQRRRTFTLAGTTLQGSVDRQEDILVDGPATPVAHSAMSSTASDSGKTLRQMARHHFNRPTSQTASAALGTQETQEDDRDVATMYTHFDARTEDAERRAKDLEKF